MSWSPKEFSCLELRGLSATITLRLGAQVRLDCFCWEHAFLWEEFFWRLQRSHGFPWNGAEFIRLAQQATSVAASPRKKKTQSMLLEMLEPSADENRESKYWTAQDLEIYLLRYEKQILQKPEGTTEQSFSSPLPSSNFWGPSENLTYCRELWQFHTFWPDQLELWRSWDQIDNCN